MDFCDWTAPQTSNLLHPGQSIKYFIQSHAGLLVPEAVRKSFAVISLVAADIVAQRSLR